VEFEELLGGKVAEGVVQRTKQIYMANFQD
jgi:hypothetical protein